VPPCRGVKPFHTALECWGIPEPGPFTTPGGLPVEVDTLPWLVNIVATRSCGDALRRYVDRYIGPRCRRTLRRRSCPVWAASSGAGVIVAVAAASSSTVPAAPASSAASVAVSLVVERGIYLAERSVSEFATAEKYKHDDGGASLKRCFP
jgi:hypothetical protein